MRPYFGGGGGRGMGGSGNMLRVVGRAVTRTGVGFQDPFPAATNAANSAAASSGAPTSPRTASGHAHNLSSRNQLSLSSASAAPFPPFSVPVSAACSAWSPFSSPQYDDYELVSADGSEDERNVYFDDFLLGTVPSIDEVHSAVSAIQHNSSEYRKVVLVTDPLAPAQGNILLGTFLNGLLDTCFLDQQIIWSLRYSSADPVASVKCNIIKLILASDEWLFGFLFRVFNSKKDPQLIRDRFGPDSDLDKEIVASDLPVRVSSTEPDSDWHEPLVHPSNSRVLQPYWPEMVIDAFHMLQNDPSVQRMVVSLSTDRAVWEAVLQNEAVKELRESCLRAEISTPSDGTSKESNNEANPLVDIVRQMFNHTRVKLMDVIEKITELMNELFSSPPPPLPSAAASAEVNAPNYPSEGKLRASFMLSLVVLLIVVVSRARGA